MRSHFAIYLGLGDSAAETRQEVEHECATVAASYHIYEEFVYMSMILGRARHLLPRHYTPAISRVSVFSAMSAPQPSLAPGSETYKPRYIDVITLSF